jgi:hypothetical protein
MTQLTDHERNTINQELDQLLANYATLFQTTPLPNEQARLKYKEAQQRARGEIRRLERLLEEAQS